MPDETPEANEKDSVTIHDMTGSARSQSDDLGGALESMTRRVGEEALAEARRQFEERGIAEKLAEAGAGVTQLAIAAGLGVAAAGAATAGVVRLYGRILPRWLAPIATAVTLGGIAVPFAVKGQERVRSTLRGI